MEPTLGTHGSEIVHGSPPGSFPLRHHTAPVNLCLGKKSEPHDTVLFTLVTLSPGIRRRRRYGATVEWHRWQGKPKSLHLRGRQGEWNERNQLQPAPGADRWTRRARRVGGRGVARRASERC